MNRESNIYTIVYASVMVILVAVLLAFTSESLKGIQNKNEDIDKMSQILRAINVETTNKNAESEYQQLITETFLVNINGDRVEGDAFQTDLEKESRIKDESKRKYPVFVAIIDGQKKYIMAMRGSGLWGPIWGYISVNGDKNTVFGSDFSHASETPGLGAEIDQPFFRHSFIGKKFYNDKGKFVSIAIVKPGKKVDNQDYVDGISGGTITSQGVDAMIKTSIGAYDKFLEKK